MSYKKFCNFITSGLLPMLILSIYLLQIYSQYSTLITFRDKFYDEQDERKTITNYSLTKDKIYFFNLDKIEECFEDNILMKINFVKNFFTDFFDSFYDNGDIRIYFFYYLVIYDLICIVFIYLFVFGSIKYGILIIFLQIFKLYNNSKRMKKYNNKLSLFEIIKNKIDNICSIREWDFFNPEGFFIIEFLCNGIIILEIIYLLILIFLKCKLYKKKKKKLNVHNVINEEDKKNKISEKDSEKEIKNKKFIKKLKKIKSPFDNNNNDEILPDESISSSSD